MVIEIFVWNNSYFKKMDVLSDENNKIMFLI